MIRCPMTAYWRVTTVNTQTIMMTYCDTKGRLTLIPSSCHYCRPAKKLKLLFDKTTIDYMLPFAKRSKLLTMYSL